MEARGECSLYVSSLLELQLMHIATTCRYFTCIQCVLENYQESIVKNREDIEPEHYLVSDVFGK